MFKVCEVYTSIQGEGRDVGVPTIFVRLQGCNLFKYPCKWCDTPQARSPEQGYGYTSPKELRLPLYTGYPICITGGEPLFQPNGLKALVSYIENYHKKYASGFPLVQKIVVETNGTIPYNKDISSINLHWCVDIKTPSSGINNMDSIHSWLEEAPYATEFKFVVADKFDLEFTADFLGLISHNPKVWSSRSFLISPAFKNSRPLVSLPEVAEFAKKHGMRFSIQLHKLIWGEKEGV